MISPVSLSALSLPRATAPAGQARAATGVQVASGAIGLSAAAPALGATGAANGATGTLPGQGHGHGRHGCRGAKLDLTV